MGDLPSFGVWRAPQGALAAPTYISAVKLTADTAVTVTPPSSAAYVMFVPKWRDAIYYVRWDGSAAAEPSTTIVGTASEPNPEMRYIADIATFSIVSPEDDTIVVMLFYSDDSESGLSRI